jgi:hypothetical protein
MICCCVYVEAAPDRAQVREHGAEIMSPIK